LGPPAQEIYGPFRAGPEEGHKVAKEPGASPVRGEAEQSGYVQPGEKKAEVVSD